MFYIISVILLVILFMVDFFVGIYWHKATTTKQNVIWTIICVVLALIFWLALWRYDSPYNAANFLTGYLTELSLSIDNVFVFYIIIKNYKVPKEFQREVLTVGIVIAFIARVIFIFLGIGLITKFAWISYFLALMLFFTGVKMAFENPEQDDDRVKEGGIMKFFKNHFKATNKFDANGKLFIKQNGVRYLTPIFFAAVFIGSVDIMFAIDSIPAALGITTNLFIVIMVNFFALFGLKQKYFLIEYIIDKIKSIQYALCVILVFIGIKIVIETLNENKLSFINGGQPLHLVHISPLFTFAFIVACLLGFIIYEQITSRKK